MPWLMRLNVATLIRRKMALCEGRQTLSSGLPVTVNGSIAKRRQDGQYSLFKPHVGPAHRDFRDLVKARRMLRPNTVSRSGSPGRLDLRSSGPRIVLNAK